jgi:anaerobic magnesium-protoporphyrin IX monomethyl ester cyclase
MARIILISPPYLDLYGKLNKAAGRYFPLGLGYIAAYLRKYGNHEIRIYEPEAEQLSYDDIAKIINDYAPDIIGITCSTPNFKQALKLAQIGRENSRAKIVMGGVHASAVPEFILEAYHDVIDCVAIGEGEETILELVGAYASGKDISAIPGIAYSYNGTVICTSSRPFIEELDRIPFPARDLIPQKLFYPNLHNGRYKECFSMLTSRGCPFNCGFCAARIVSGKRYRVHSAEYVLEEMSMLKSDYSEKIECSMVLFFTGNCSR